MEFPKTQYPSFFSFENDSETIGAVNHMDSIVFSVPIPSKGKERDKTMPAKSTTTITGIENKAKNQVNRQLTEEFFHHLTIFTYRKTTKMGYSRSIRYAECLGPEAAFYHIHEKQQMLKFLDSKMKTKECPDKKWKWITTWNDYLWR